MHLLVDGEAGESFSEPTGFLSLQGLAAKERHIALQLAREAEPRLQRRVVMTQVLVPVLVPWKECAKQNGKYRSPQ